MLPQKGGGRGAGKVNIHAYPVRVSGVSCVMSFVDKLMCVDVVLFIARHRLVLCAWNRWASKGAKCDAHVNNNEDNFGI